jgi:uncharacterized protein YaeQ
MALKATIHKVNLQIADMDRHYYQDHSLTIARHPSETDERMMLRIAVFALHAHEQLKFTRGLSTDDEPDMWLKNLHGDIDLWIELGQPDEKRIRKACGQAQEVWVYCYSGSSAELWWQQNQGKLQRFGNLSVVNIPAKTSQQLGTLAERNMSLHCSIQDKSLWIGNEVTTIEIKPQVWKIKSDSKKT